MVCIDPILRSKDRKYVIPFAISLGENDDIKKLQFRKIALEVP